MHRDEYLDQDEKNNFIISKEFLDIMESFSGYRNYHNPKTDFKQLEGEGCVKVCSSLEFTQ